LEKTFERRASAAPFLCMIFLNWEWPAMSPLRCGAALYDRLGEK
jgi:hypothetical protein